MAFIKAPKTSKKKTLFIRNKADFALTRACVSTWLGEGRFFKIKSPERPTKAEVTIFNFMPFQFHIGFDGRCASRISSKFRDGGNTSIERYVIQHSCASFARTYVFITQPILTQAALAEIINRPCPRLLV